MRLVIEALDPLFFRDGRPFTMGENDWGGSIFPPPPGVFYGALRALYFSHHPEELALANSEKDPTRELRVNLFYWLVGETRIPAFPLPLECVGLEESQCLVRRPARAEGMVSNHPLPLVLEAPVWGEKTFSPEKNLIDHFTLAAYLRGETVLTAQPLSDYLVGEPKVGIGRDRSTLGAEEHKLYRITMNRLKNLALAVCYEGIEIPPSGFLRLGGEGRVATYTLDSGEELEVLRVREDQVPETRFFKLYLVTPAFFENGWLPGWLHCEDGDIRGRYKNLELRLLAAAVGRPLPLGGFSMRPPAPKVMRRAVPAGSVYYFEIVRGRMAEVVRLFHARSVSEYRAEEGFGIAFVGVPDEVNV